MEGCGLRVIAAAGVGFKKQRSTSLIFNDSRCKQPRELSPLKGLCDECPVVTKLYRLSELLNEVWLHH